MDALNQTIEFALWAITCVGLLLGLLLRIGEVMYRVIAWGRRACFHGRLARPRAMALVLAGVLAASLTVPVPALAGQGWWWGSPITPGFDRNTVIRVAGTASRVDIVSRGGPSTLRLDTADESFTVMLAPGWYLAELRADIRSGDPLIVEGSKMMDRRQQVYLVAARITNQRTGAVLELRDEAGRPRWMGGRPSSRSWQ